MEQRLQYFSLMLSLLYVFANIFFRTLPNDYYCNLVLSMDEHIRIFACILVFAKGYCTRIFIGIFMLNVYYQK